MALPGNIANIAGPRFFRVSTVSLFYASCPQISILSLNFRKEKATGAVLSKDRHPADVGS